MNQSSPFTVQIAPPKQPSFGCVLERNSKRETSFEKLRVLVSEKISAFKLCLLHCPCMSKNNSKIDQLISKTIFLRKKPSYSPTSCGEKTFQLKNLLKRWCCLPSLSEYGHSPFLFTFSPPMNDPLGGVGGVGGVIRGVFWRQDGLWGHCRSKRSYFIFQIKEEKKSKYGSDQSHPNWDFQTSPRRSQMERLWKGWVGMGTKHSVCGKLGE